MELGKRIGAHSEMFMKWGLKEEIKTNFRGSPCKIFHKVWNDVERKIWSNLTIKIESNISRGLRINETR